MICHGDNHIGWNIFRDRDVGSVECFCDVPVKRSQIGSFSIKLQVLKGIIDGGFVDLDTQQAVPWSSRSWCMSGQLFVASQAIAKDQTCTCRGLQIDCHGRKVQLFQWTQIAGLKTVFEVDQLVHDFFIELISSSTRNTVFVNSASLARLRMVLVPNKRSHHCSHHRQRIKSSFESQ